MELIDLVERPLHTRNPAFVHARYEPGRCPYCSWQDNLRAMVAAKLASHSP